MGSGILRECVLCHLLKDEYIYIGRSIQNNITQLVLRPLINIYHIQTVSDPKICLNNSRASMEWRVWLLIIFIFETTTEAAVAKPHISTEAQRTQGSQKPMYEHAIHQPSMAQESLVLPGTDSRSPNHRPEVMIGLVFQSSNPKREAERSYVRIPLHRRFQAGTQYKPSFPSAQSPDPE